jgi:subtilisin family serine protease
LCALAVASVIAAAPLLVSATAEAAPGPPGSREWWFDTWDVDSLWSGGARGQGITIAEIDSGVNADVPELAGKLLDGYDYGDPSTLGHRDHDLDKFGHGTAMASLMVAEPGYGDITGLAPDAQLLPIAVPLIGTDIEGTADGSVGQAVRWATDHGAKIISMSLGADRDPNRDPEPCPRDEQDAITYAVSKGVIVVAGSGNDGESGSPVAAPGVCIGVISVGAVDSRNQVASFSSRHPYLTMTAPGVNIPTLSRIPHEAYIGAGTSQATAISSAAIALVWSKYPKATNFEIVARVLATVDHKSGGAPDPAYGYGIVNPARAINTAVPADAANPLYDQITPFLERAAAKAARTVDAPARVVPSADDFGTVTVGSAPSVYDTQVVGGAALALAGLLLLIVLIVLGIARSRSYRRARRLAQWPPAPEAAVTTD